ncbi:MAG: hemerythrin domain-containing protein [Methylibium sp.]|uniref:hemerythrin domain-containing protein n=1 Tax=Methylibium sp. TaxID=2067992 RepID=UPI0017A3B8CF|nr:hemerythrin domain-containing protein [Methylibium sp.]MBA2723187.1 hemerythrin domain-containing protein [Methylibium sp.]MBA3589877.1 hemerythrin domain-containing protein [Methylibium sp.]MBA3623248.1 hemerythrin domain-containing protein [Methylibium sp.]
MTPTLESQALAATTLPDGFDVLDVCHRQTVLTLGKLAALISSLVRTGPDPDSRALANEIIRHFSTTARLHHEDEERHLFPRLLRDGDAATTQTVQRLQQDHAWLEQDWKEILPHLDAVASGQSWYDLDFLREAAAVFTALSHDHIALEESFIYPHARSRMGDGERRDMGREMAARRRPERQPVQL